MYLLGHANIRKRLLIHPAGFNLGLLMRQLIDVGTPRGLQGRLVEALSALLTLIRTLWQPVTRHWPPGDFFSARDRLSIVQNDLAHVGVWRMAFATGCWAVTFEQLAGMAEHRPRSRALR